MLAPAVAFEVPESPAPGHKPEPESKTELGDVRFRALMSEAEWASLPRAIRRRFSKRLAGGQTIVYAGEILESWTSRTGWWLAQAARLIGGPLPLTIRVWACSCVRWPCSGRLSHDLPSALELDRRPARARPVRHRLITS